MDFGVEGFQADSEYLCGKILVPLRVLQNSFDVVTVELTKRDGAPHFITPGRHMTIGRIVARKGQIFEADIIIRRKDGRTFQYIFELTHVAGPIVSYQRLDRVRMKFLRRPVLQTLRDYFVGDQRNIFLPLTQGWKSNGNDIEAVQQVFAEPSLLHLIGKMPVCCGNNPDIGFLRFVSANPSKLSHLNKSKKFRLEDRTDFSNLVKKKCPSGCQLHQSLMHCGCVGKRPFFVSEEFALY